MVLQQSSTREDQCLGRVRGWVLPDTFGHCVILMNPWLGFIDGFTINTEPLPHLTQTLLKYGQDSTIMSWSNIHQQVTTTTK